MPRLAFAVYSSPARTILIGPTAGRGSRSALLRAMDQARSRGRL